MNWENNPNYEHCVTVKCGKCKEGIIKHFYGRGERYPKCVNCGERYDEDEIDFTFHGDPCLGVHTFIKVVNPGKYPAEFVEHRAPVYWKSEGRWKF